MMRILLFWILIPSQGRIMTTNNKHDAGEGATRRDFLHIAAAGVGAVGAAGAMWPFVDQMNPAADTLALASIEVDLSAIEVGQTMVVKWRGKPVFIRHRTPEEISESEAVVATDMIDPEDDAARVVKPEWLVIIGVCTHLGCVPGGSARGDVVGEYGGWFCPCHGSHYDTSGRIRKGPAPTNLEVPAYTFLTDTRIKVG